MKFGWILVLSIIILLLPTVALAYNPYGEIYTYEVYFNGKHLPDTEVAKPTLKIDEPFIVCIDITVYQKSDVYVELTESGEDNFEIIRGPTSEIGRYSDGDVCEPNSTHRYEWTVKPTENWAGGALPLHIYYTILEHGNPEPLVNSGFTVAYLYISTEHYEGDSTPPTTTIPDSPPSTESPNSIPAFTLLTTTLAIAFAIRKQ